MNKNSLYNLFKKYRNDNKAILAFNIQNIYQLKAIKKVLEFNTEYVIIVQFSMKYVDYFDEVYGFRKIIKEYEGYNIFFHLDHCNSIPIIMKCIQLGFHSVMFDGSNLPLDENVKQTNLVYEITSSNSVLLEAEIGAIHGVEDDFENISNSKLNEEDISLFITQSKFDLLALGVGNQHGIYSNDISIDIDKFKYVNSTYNDILTVLHGVSSMPDSLIYKAISYGVIKLNISTELKLKSIECINEFCELYNSYDEIKFSNYMVDRLSDFFLSKYLKYSC